MLECYYVFLESWFVKKTTGFGLSVGFRFWGCILTRTEVRVGFGFKIRVLVFIAQTLHPNRTQPVAILRLKSVP